MKIKKVQRENISVKVQQEKQSVISPVKKTHCIFLFVFAFMLYANTLHHDYAFDDGAAITLNSFTQAGIAGIPDLVKKDFFGGVYGQGIEYNGGRWRPLSLVTFALEIEFFGQNPHISHLINVLLYGLTAVILFIMMQTILPNKLLLNFLITLLFIAHPVHTEVVANIKSRDEILAFLGLCLTILWLFKFLETGKRKFILFSCMAYFLALTSKESAITFAGIIPLTLFCFTNKSWKESLVKSIPLFIVAFIFVVIRWKLVGMALNREDPDIMENPFIGAALSEKYATIVKILGLYLLKLFFPFTLSSDYSFNEIPRVDWNNAGALVSLLIYLSLVVFSIIIIIKKNSPHAGNQPSLFLIAYGILFYLITISIVSNAVIIVGPPMAERFLFIPSLGFCIAFSVLLLKVLKIADWDSLKFNPKVFVPASIILVLFSYKTITRNPDWFDNKTLFIADAVNVPNSAKVHYYYGTAFLNPQIGKPDSPEKRDDLKIALREEKIAIKINPQFHHAYYKTGLIYQELENGDSAVWYFEKVLQLQPRHILSQRALGVSYAKFLENHDKAIEHLKIAVKYDLKDWGAWDNLGVAYAMKKNFAEAVKAFTEALKYKKDDSRLFYNTALTYDNLNDTVNAKINYDKAFALEPGLKQPVQK